jgi:hypothetical protein
VQRFDTKKDQYFKPKTQTKKHITELKKLLFVVNLLLLANFSFAQNTLLEGKIINSKSGLSVPSAKIIRLDSLFDVRSDQKGFFKISVPETGTVELLFSHPDFILTTKEIVPKQVNAPLLISLTPIERKADTLYLHYNNIVSFFPTELLNGAIALRYERFIKPRHSIGLHSSLYLFGFIHPVPPITYYNYEADFRGFKLGPFYRYYINRKTERGVFIEAKPLVGYFNFYHLGKKSTSSIVYNPKETWLFGGSTAIGLSFIPNGKRLIINLSLGFQYFPIKFENSIPDDYGYTSEFSDSWWYWGGPGSYIEFKFSIGGIF